MGEVQRQPTAEQLRCWLEALRDGSPGVYQETSQLAAANGTSGGGTRHVVHGDRTYDTVGWFSSSGATGSSSSQYGPSRCELFPPEHFSACLDALDAATTPPPDAGEPSATTYRWSDCGIGTNCVETAGTCP
jgi:hypothetical protein